jgi:alpha-mannosidase
VHDGRKVVEDRVARLLRERIRPAVHPVSAPLDVERWDTPGEPVPFADAVAAQYRPSKPGDAWGPPWSTTWFRVRGEVPTEWRGRIVEAAIDLGFATDRPGFSAEGLVYTPRGVPTKGLNPRNTWIPIAAPAEGGEPVDLLVEAAANPFVLGVPVTDLGDVATAGDVPAYVVGELRLVQREPQVWELVHDLEVLQQLMLELPVDGARRWDLVYALERALDVLDPHDVAATATAARERLRDVLARPAHASAHRVSAVGHAHIDSAWLWPLRESVRKVARTTANVATLMDHDPDLVFAMSQAQQWAWLRDQQPALYERIKAYVADGRMVPVGGMWVESDTNMPGGEALARQFVHGKRFFLDELGVETREVWLPDSFGYSAALPQLVALSGSRWFLTQKLSWNRTNAFPHHTFHWEGIDGTRVFTHFPPVDTYNAELSGAELAHAVRTFADKGAATRSLVPFGHGNGGGGPTREMLARARRLADLEGSPRVALESPSTFFAAAEQELADPPVWAGELYLELHRGTYTSQAEMKRGNRRCEHLLREAELWAATAAVRVGHPYPYDALDRIWKTVLLYQFHDILPGSSIAWVHREARDTYGKVIAELDALVVDALAALTAGAPDGTNVVNAAPHPRRGIAAMAAAPPPATTHPPVTHHPTDGGGHVLDNGVVRVTIDARGLVTSALDLLADREAIAPGHAGNLLQLHPDFPVAWDAWDIDAHHRAAVTDLTDAVSVRLAEATPRRAAVEVVRRHGRSTFRQVLTLDEGDALFGVRTEVDWHEHEALLKLAFPLDLHTQWSASEIQFGHVRRPTHTNTSWDAAKFEICAHRWLHVGEPGWGCALVNDRTYGHDVTRYARPGGGTTTTVRASLLRAPRYPDPHTDEGRHAFEHALVIGAGIPDAVREGYRINVPERRVDGAMTIAPMVTSTDGIVVEAVKLADDGSGDVVVRCYEAYGARRRGELTLGFDADGVTVTDLLERPLADAAPVAIGDAAVPLDLRPFEIITLRLAR